MHYVVNADPNLEIHGDAAKFPGGDCSMNFTDVDWLAKNEGRQRYEPTAEAMTT